MSGPGEKKCPCGATASGKLWEADVYLCGPHIFEWIRSEEKKRCTRGEKFGEPGGGPGDPAVAASDEEIRRAVEDFVNRIAPRGFWARLKRWIRNGLRGQP